MVSFSLCFAFGIWWLQQQAVLPPPVWGEWLAVCAPAWLLPRRSVSRLLGLGVFAALLGFCYAAWCAQLRLSDCLPADWQGRDIEVVGVVADLPRRHEHGLRFVFDVEQVLTAGAEVPRHLALSTFDSEQDPPLPLQAGARWHLTVRLKRPHGTANPYGYDYEAWLLARDLRATGYVQRRGDNHLQDALVRRPVYLVQHVRERIRERFHQALGDHARYAGVLVALAIGDQASIPSAQWQVFTRTGVNHLMSISGLHITMLGGLAYAITYRLWRRSTRLTLRFPALKAAALAGLLVALAYALLSGYAIPAQRTVYMLGAVAAALLLARNLAPSQLLAFALLAALLADPWAVLAPGFWLSFSAVGLILYVSANRIGKRHWLHEYAQVQWAMLIGLIPLTLALFQQISLVAPLANAFAIPLVSFLVVPLALLGAALPFDAPLWLAHGLMDGIGWALDWLSRLPDAVWVQHAPPAWSIPLGIAGALWLLTPRGFPSRWLGGLMLAPLFLVTPMPPPPDTLRLTIFDVGQGLAVAAQTHGHALLYDTGPDFSGEADSGNRILVPSLRAQGLTRLDALVLTHDDLDHTGGAASVLQTLPVGRVYSSLPDGHALLRERTAQLPCRDGQGWEWDGIRFRFLHPEGLAASKKTHDNDLGCVLRIEAGAHSVLLAADIEKASEARLLAQHPESLRADVLVVPHHGSRTSSTPGFVAAVHPRHAVFTVGYRNRYGHPKEEVVARYREIGSEVLRSDVDGAILIDMGPQRLELQRYRPSHARYWQLTPTP